MEDSLVDLLSLYTVDDGVHHWRRQQVNIGHDNLYQRRGMLGKLMGHRHPNHGHIEDQNSQHVGQTVIEGPQSLRPRGCAQDTFQDECVGEHDEQRVHHNNEQNHSKSIPVVDSGVSTDQANHILVEAVGVREKVGAAEGQALE